MFKEGYDDYRRYLMDKSENNRETEIFSPNHDGNGSNWKTVIWHNIKVGDIIRLRRDDWVPADLLILHSNSEGGIAYIETMALDGETNLKSKQALPVIAKGCDTEEKLARFAAEVISEDPNPDLYNFDGKVVVDGDTKPLTGNQIVFRGSVLRNTPEMLGMVIFTGEETKIRMKYVAPAWVRVWLHVLTISTAQTRIRERRLRLSKASSIALSSLWCSLCCFWQPSIPSPINSGRKTLRRIRGTSTMGASPDSPSLHPMSSCECTQLLGGLM